MAWLEAQLASHESLERRLREVQERADQAQARRAELETEVRQRTDQADAAAIESANLASRLAAEARARLSAERELADIREAAARALVGYDGELARAAAVVENERAERTRAESRAADLEARLLELEADHTAALEAELERRTDKLTRALEGSEKHRKNAEQEASRLTTALETSSRTLQAEIVEIVASHQRDVQRLNMQSDQAKERHDRLVQQVAELKTELERARSGATALRESQRRQLTTHRREMADAQAAQQRAESALRDAEADAGRLSVTSEELASASAVSAHPGGAPEIPTQAPGPLYVDAAALAATRSATAQARSVLVELEAPERVTAESIDHVPLGSALMSVAAWLVSAECHQLSDLEARLATAGLTVERAVRHLNDWADREAEHRGVELKNAVVEVDNDSHEVWVDNTLGGLLA